MQHDARVYITVKEERLRGGCEGSQAEALPERQAGKQKGGVTSMGKGGVAGARTTTLPGQGWEGPHGASSLAYSSTLQRPVPPNPIQIFLTL